MSTDGVVDTYLLPATLMLTISQKASNFLAKGKLKEKINKQEFFIYLLKFDAFNFSLLLPPNITDFGPFLFNFYYSSSEAENHARTLLRLQLLGIILFEE